MESLALEVKIGAVRKSMGGPDVDRRCSFACWDIEPTGVEMGLIFIVGVVNIDEWLSTVMVVLGVVHFCVRWERVFLSLLEACADLKCS